MTKFGPIFRKKSFAGIHWAELRTLNYKKMSQKQQLFRKGDRLNFIPTVIIEDLFLFFFIFSLFQVSKWKLYKTARKRGIYAEIKKQNQAQVRKTIKKTVTLIEIF